VRNEQANLFDFSVEMQMVSLQELLLLGLQQLKIQEALLLYSRGLVSFGRAAEIAGLPEKEMIWQARAAGTQPRWSKAMAEEELA
jgi:hypothetical protein